MNDAYEWRTFTIGERVRCVPSPECKAPADPTSPSAMNGRPTGHGDHECNRVGVIVPPGRFLSESAIHRSREIRHPYIVLWDDSFVHQNGQLVIGNAYAAAELEPA